MKVKLKDGAVFVGDSLKVLREKIPYNSVDLIFTSTSIQHRKRLRDA